MRPGQDSRAVAYLAIDDSSFSLPGINIELLRETRQHFHLLNTFRIHKYPATIIIRPKECRHRPRRQRLFGHLQLSSPRPGLTMVDEPRECPSTTDPREEGQFALADNLHGLIAHLELAPLAAVITPRTETQVCAAPANELPNASVASAIEFTAVAQISTTGNDQHCASQGPWLFNQHIARDGDHGVVGGQQSAEGVETVTDGFDGGAISYKPLDISLPLLS